ncbi:MAG: hypothetical protein JNL21_16985 [Myxococcales bacterium]|nr:hypothetical protein [Myxococcales bacterium]
MAEDPPRRNTLRMGALPEQMPEPRAPHPASITRAGPQRYVLIGEAPTRKKQVRAAEPEDDDPAALFDELTPHLGWLPEERRPELRRLLLRGELERALQHFEEERERFPRNVSVERCQKIVERVLMRRLTLRLLPSEHVPVMTGELSSHKPKDPRALVAARIDGESTVDEILRELSFPRLKGLIAFEGLLAQGLIAWKTRSERAEEPAVSERPTLSDPIESAAIAELTRPPRAEPAPAPVAAPAPVPAAERAPVGVSEPEREAEPVPEPEPATAAAHAPATDKPAAVSVPPRASLPSSAAPPDNSRRLVTALVGTTGAAVGIAVVAIIFAMRGPAPTTPGPAPTQRAAPTPAQPQITPSPAPTASTVPPPVPAASTIQLTMEVSPNYARVYLDKARLKAPYAQSLPKDGAAHELKIEAPGHKTKKVPFQATSDLSLVIALEALPKKAKPASSNEDIY